MALQMANLAALKSLALSRLKPNSPLREILMSEPDEISFDEWAIKSKIYLKMLYRELPLSSLSVI